MSNPVTEGNRGLDARTIGNGVSGRCGKPMDAPWNGYQYCYNRIEYRSFSLGNVWEWSQRTGGGLLREKPNHLFIIRKEKGCKAEYASLTRQQSRSEQGMVAARNRRGRALYGTICGKRG